MVEFKYFPGEIQPNKIDVYHKGVEPVLWV